MKLLKNFKTQLEVLTMENKVAQSNNVDYIKTKLGNEEWIPLYESIHTETDDKFIYSGLISQTKKSCCIGVKKH